MNATERITGVAVTNPIEPLLADEQVTEILIDGPNRIYVDRKGKFEETDIRFKDNEELMAFIRALAEPTGQTINESHPLVDVRFPDGSRMNAVAPQIALNGPTVTFRKMTKNPLTKEDVIHFGSAPAEAFDFLEACIKTRLNIIVAGGTGSGKTTILNILAGLIPPAERIIIIQNNTELALPETQTRVVTLESRPPNLEGKGAVTVQSLVTNATKMRPDRIILSEIQGTEALKFLESCNMGYDGSMASIHANSPRDTLARLENMCLMADTGLPVRAIREQIASGIDVIVQQMRLHDGTRKITAISEVVGMEGNVISLQDIFKFEEEGFENGRIQGWFKPTGIIPNFLDRIHTAAIDLPISMFKPN